MEQAARETINQKAKEYLLDFIDQVTPVFKAFFEEQRTVAANINPIAVDMVDRYADYIGGKRLRGALTKLGYDLFGGTQTQDILKVSTIIEMIHGFALMHDDIYDQDRMRRKKPAMHVQFETLFDEIHQNEHRHKDLYGISMATNLGDIGSYFSNLVLANTQFDAEEKINFLRRLSEVVIQTVYGQAMDITFELESRPQEDKVMLIHKYKTAYYTIPGPLQYGAILAGLDRADSRFTAIEDYGVPVGIAFQLRDDELGMFSTSEKFGKPIFSDLRQGKNTLLFSYAFEHANDAQLKTLLETHGNQNVNDTDLQRVNKILIDTGAVDYSQKLCWDLVSQGKKHISKVTDDAKSQELLDLVADYVVTRNS